MSTANLYSTLVQRYERLVKGQEGRSESLRMYFDNGILLKAHTATKISMNSCGIARLPTLINVKSALLYGGLLCGRVRASLGAGSNPTALHKF